MEFPQLPGYLIQKEIGRGARGVVYLAHQGQASYAIKVQNSPEDRSLLRYGAVLACIRHPGLPEVLEVGELDGRPYLVSEYVAGCSLAAELDTGPLPEPGLVELAKTLAGALHEVHRRGLIHRDIKPANILLARGGGARLIDFGFATRIHDHSPHSMGTYLFSPPEQTGMLARPVDQRADLYALGGVLFCCATGHPPYNESDPAELLRRHASAPVARVREANPQISPVLAAIIEKLLCKDPGDRYQTAQSLLADLRALSVLNQRAGDNLPVRLGEHAQEPERGPTTLVGREAELRELHTALQRALQNQGQSVLLEGESGSGKSLLLDEFLRQAARSVPLILRTTCEAGRSPYAPLRLVVNQYFQELASLPQAARRRIEVELQQQPPELVRHWSTVNREARALFGKTESLVGPAAGDQFLEAAAAFFAVVARIHGSALMVLEDVHQMDEGTLQVLSRLRARLSGAPLMLVASCRVGLKGSERYLQAVEPRPRLTLASLDQSEVEVLVHALLGSRPVNSELTRLLAHRSRGNPFAVTEYVRAMLNSGAILPGREGWRFDQASLQQLELPSDVIQLVLRRMNSLDASTQALLSRAALLGSNFSVAILAALEKCPQRSLGYLLEAAVRANVLESSSPDAYLFVHDRLREAFLARLDEHQQRAGHRQIAEAMQGLLAEHPDLRYAQARHYALGENDEVRDRVYETNLDAGRRAMRQFAYEDAYMFFSQAARSRGQDHMDWMSPLSLACEHTHRTEEAIQLLEAMLAYNQPSLQRVQWLGRLAQLRSSKLDRTGARDECHKALAVIGKGTLDHPLWNPLAAVYCLGRWALTEWLGWGRGASRGQQRQLDLALSSLYRLYGEGEYFDMRYAKMFEMASRSCLASFRLGVSPQLVVSYSNLLVFLGLLRRPGLVERWAARVERFARQLHDPVSQAYFEVARCISLHIAGLSEEVDRRQEELLLQRAHVLEPSAFMLGVADLAFSLFMRGQVRQAWVWVQRGLERCRLTSSPVGVARDEDILACYAISCLSVLGQSGEALTFVERLKGRCHNEATDRSLRANYFGHLLSLHLETRELGLPMEEAGREFLRLKLSPALAPLHRRHFYVLWCYCWLERCYSNEKDLPALDQALEELRKTANRPVLQGHYQVARAGRQYLAKAYPAALDSLAKAQDLADLNDAPWISFEVARLKSRVLTRLGKFDVAAREAERAYHLALEFGWSSRARAVAREFSLARSSRSPGSASLEVKPSPEETLGIRLERQLNALLHLSLSSSQLVGPKDQTRVVLDELIGLLSAERAFVFLANPSGLFYFTGRDMSGITLEEPTGYSHTVLEMVRSRREPLVIAGTEQGDVLGSKSIIDHNLRSIICAPLTVRDEFAGVIYLDNRLARGVFAEQDLGILRAVSNHISVGIEAARAAHLEMEVESERRQRTLADALSVFTSHLSSTLEPDTIADLLLDALARAVPLARATVWLGSPDRLVLSAQRGYPAELTPGRRISAVEHEGFERACDLRKPVLETGKGRDPVWAEMLIAQSFNWLALPLVSEGKTTGLVTLCAESVDLYSEAEVDVAFTFCNQAGIALAKAHLFKSLHQYLEMLRGLIAASSTLADRSPDQLRRQAVETASQLLGGVPLEQSHESRPGAFELGNLGCFWPTEPTSEPQHDVLRLWSHLVRAAHDRTCANLQLAQASKLAAIGQLAAGVAHELNTPLSALTLSINSARQSLQSRPERADSRLEKAQLAVQQMQSIISKLLYYAREAGQGRRTVDVSDVIRDSLQMLEHTWQEADIRLECQISSALVMANPGQIQQILINLLNNAALSVKDCPPPWNVRLELDSRDGLVVVQVWDSGPGVDPAVAERIFEPFFTTREVGQGTGLGLSISREIAEKHGGTLAFLGGSTFELRLPKA